MEDLVVAAVSTRNFIGQFDQSIADMKRWAARAKRQAAEIILFPELNVTGYMPAEVASELAEIVPGPSTDKIIKIAQDEDMIICFGIIEKDQYGVYCTQILADAGGIIGKQRKIHVPFHERPYWKAGDSIEIFDLGKAKVGIAICRDAFFGEMTRTHYFKGAEIVLMPFGYYNVPRSQYLTGTIHGMSIQKTSWANGFFSVVCNSAGDRPPNEWEPKGRKFPGWAGVIDPWGHVKSFFDDQGNDEAMVVERLTSEELEERRRHPNFLAEELRPDLYQFEKKTA